MTNHKQKKRPGLSAQEYRRRLNISQLEQYLNKNRQTVWRWYTPGQVGFCNFPTPHFLGQDRNWFLDEVQAWETKRMAELAASKSAA